MNQRSQTTSGVVYRDGKIEGYAVVFYDGTPKTECRLGKNTVERVSPDCKIHFADDVQCNFDHDRKQYIARSGNGTLELTKNSKGVYYTASVADTASGKDLITLVKRGDVYGSSFEFPDDTTKTKITREGKTNVVTITEMVIHRVNPTFSPAYEGTQQKRCDDIAQQYELLERLKHQLTALEIISRQHIQKKIQKIDEITKLSDR